MLHYGNDLFCLRMQEIVFVHLLMGTQELPFIYTMSDFLQDHDGSMEVYEITWYCFGDLFCG